MEVARYVWIVDLLRWSDPSSFQAAKITKLSQELNADAHQIYASFCIVRLWVPNAVEGEHRCRTELVWESKTFESHHQKPIHHELRTWQCTCMNSPFHCTKKPLKLGHFRDQPPDLGGRHVFRADRGETRAERPRRRRKRSFCGARWTWPRPSTAPWRTERSGKWRGRR